MALMAAIYQNAYLSHGATPEQFALNPTLGQTGESLPEIPRLQFSTNLEYTHLVANDVLGVLAANLTYRGKTDAYFVSNTLNVPLHSYSLLDLRMGVETGPWSVNLFARNATNKRAEITALAAEGNPLYFFTVRPRTFGLNVTRTF